ncbi:MAG TPA: DUF2892 domain-containing protein [Burkholderiales bacterium]|nr:DUF2892 domain-containing protein [Burkholderiales bacterium]
MTTERIIRSFAGLVVLASLALGVWVNPNWLWLTAFAGANLLQSGFTRFCLPEIVLKRLGVGGEPKSGARA